MSPAADPLRDIFLGRQPVLNRSEVLIGYELLFRATGDDILAHDGSAAAPSDLVCSAFAELGLPDVLGRVRTFINVNPHFLDNAAIELLPKNMVVFELDVATLNDPGVPERCRELKAAGYNFSITNIRDAASVQDGKADFASYLKVNLKHLSPQQIQSVASDLKTTRMCMIASGVETQTQLEFCTLIGFELFQGYYFANPTVIEGRSLDPSTLGVFKIIQLLAADAETPELEDAFRKEPALVVNLMRLTNSVGVGARSRVTSVRQAIATIGRRQLQRWLQLLVLSRSGEPDVQRNPRMQYAALRARFMELLAERLYPKEHALPDLAFIAGLMSLIPGALGITLTDVLDKVGLPDEVRLALLSGDGHLGHVLKLTECYDANNVEAVQTLLPPGMGVGILGEILGRALSWVEKLDEVQQ